MQRYDFYCDEHSLYEVVQARMTEGPTTPLCPIGDHPMTRRYGDFQTTVYHGKVYDYIDKAYRGEEVPAGMTTAQVRAIVDTNMRTAHKGRANARVYKTAR